MRLVFMGTPEIAVPILEALVGAGHEIVAVYTQADRPAGRGQTVFPSPVKQAALKHSIPVMQPASLRDPEEFERLSRSAPDLIVVAAFGQFLPKAVLDLPPFKCLNVHPSLLPRHRGPAPIVNAILEGDEETGVTIMRLTAKMDAGPILAQRRVPIDAKDTAATLQARLAQVGADLLVDTLPRWLGGEIAPQLQDEAKVTFSKMVAKEDGFLDWGQAAVDLWRRVRAFQPWPGAYTRWRGKMLKVIEAKPLGRGQEQRPGSVLKLDPTKTGFGLGVQTGDGVLALGMVQFEGRKSMSGEDFLRGHREIVGEVLPGEGAT
ncbi:MAG: methionyl-tRNA formyltransferase [Chloroflexi bacterium]|nr:methionyl-tRNA formyltransferase [Chloroflexota bacterium]